MAIVSFSVSSETNRIVIRLAKKLKVTKSKVVELAMENYIKHQRDMVTLTVPRDWRKFLKNLPEK